MVLTVQFTKKKQFDQMMTNRLVILGDCASNGANCIAAEVTGETDIRVSYSLPYHRRHNDIIKWYMQKRKEGKYTKSIPMHKVQHESIKALFARELEVSWPSLLNGDVYNYSYTGNTFQGYLADIKKHIALHGKPDLVAVTCYSPDHVYVRVRSKLGARYNGIVHKTWIDKPYNAETMNYSEEIYDKKQKQGKKEYTGSQAYLNRKTYHSWYWLRRFLKTNNIDYFCIRFRRPLVLGIENITYNLFENEKMLDLCQTHEVYNHYLEGDQSTIKLNSQKIIALAVEKFIREDL